MMILVYQSRKGIIEAQAMAYWVWSLWSGQFILIKFLYHPLEEKKQMPLRCDISLTNTIHSNAAACFEPSILNQASFRWSKTTRRASWEQEVLRDYEDAISNVLKKQPKLNWVIGRA